MKNKQVSFRVEDTELEALKTKLKGYRLSIQDYFRGCLDVVLKDDLSIIHNLLSMDDTPLPIVNNDYSALIENNKQLLTELTDTVKINSERLDKALNHIAVLQERLDQAPSPETHTQQGLKDITPELALLDNQGINTPEIENKAIIGNSERAKIETLSENIDFEIIKGDCAIEAVAVEDQSPIVDVVSSTAPMERLEGNDDSSIDSNLNKELKEKSDHEAIIKEYLDNFVIGEAINKDNPNKELKTLLAEMVNKIVKRKITKDSLSRVAKNKDNPLENKPFKAPDILWEYFKPNDKGNEWEWTRIK